MSETIELESIDERRTIDECRPSASERHEQTHANSIVEITSDSFDNIEQDMFVAREAHAEHSAIAAEDSVR
jgi:hypothetical protein